MIINISSIIIIIIIIIKEEWVRGAYH